MNVFEQVNCIRYNWWILVSFQSIWVYRFPINDPRFPANTFTSMQSVTVTKESPRQKWWKFIFPRESCLSTSIECKLHLKQKLRLFYHKSYLFNSMKRAIEIREVEKGQVQSVNNAAFVHNLLAIIIQRMKKAIWSFELHLTFELCQ